MEFQEIEIRGIKLKVWYAVTSRWEEGMRNFLDIHSIQHEYIEMYDFCEWYNILPDIYSELWKHI